MNERKPLTPTTARQTMRVAWIAMITSNLFLTLAMVLKASSEGWGGSPFAATYRPYFVGFALLAAATSFWWKGRCIARRAATHATLVHDSPAQLQGRVRESVIAWALCDLVSILGFAFGSISRDLTIFLPFVGGALLLLYLHRPTTWPGYADGA